VVDVLGSFSLHMRLTYNYFDTELITVLQRSMQASSEGVEHGNILAKV